MDLGREMACSKEVAVVISKHGYTLEPTSAASSFQNGIVERPHQTLANMMQSMLNGANMDNSFWADALIHAVYLKNRLPQKAINMTQFEKLHGHKPNLHHLRVFGSRIIVKNPGQCSGKLNCHISEGSFLHYAGTNRNIHYFDHLTQNKRAARHVKFDETHYHYNAHPPYATKL